MAAQNAWIAVKEFLELFPDFYWAGFFGHWAVEVYAALRYAILHNGKCPPLYKKPFYVMIRVFFSLCVAAPLPHFLGADTLLSAVYIGASAPLIIERMASGSLIGKNKNNNDHEH